MPIDRPSGGYDETGTADQGHPAPADHEMTQPGEAADQPRESAAKDDPPPQRPWPDIDSSSDEDLTAFLGLDRTDRAPAIKDLDPPGRRSVGQAVGAEMAAGVARDAHREPGLVSGAPEGSRDVGSDQSRKLDEPRDGIRLTEEQLDEARGWLRENHPSPVEHPGQGLKTWGVWWDDQGGSGVDSSGRDERSNLAKTYLVEQGVPAVADLKHHVEMKIAAKMRAAGIQDVALVINNVPCEGMYSCSTWLGKVVPDGSTLRIYGHDGTEYPLFRGEA